MTNKTKEVFETKWGYVAYSYEDYQNLKRLNIIFQKARAEAARWKRWVRKEPQNRVQKIKIRNELGQKVGHKIGNPIPEPRVCDLFATKLVDNNDNPIYSYGDTWRKFGLWPSDYIYIDNTVEVEYQHSHRPVKDIENVPEAKLSSLEIQQLLEKAQQWKEEQK